ncbi:MAG: DUF6261 family protein [Tannerella sp.]|jgi:hypothetical protein|nr:DUF6261 family protein [Tannerella sp.]
MKKIVTVHLRTFNNEEHYEFLVVLKDLLLVFQAAKTVVGADYDTLLVQIDEEKALINNMRKSDFTQTIADTDQRIDRTVTGMNSLIDVGLHHFDPTAVEAARILKNRFKAFGDITHKAYEEQTADVNILIGDLNSDQYAGKVTLLGLSPWVTELAEAEATFESLIRQRNTESAQKPQGDFRSVRRDSDILYHRMTDRINAAATIAAAPIYDDFINEINARIEYFNTHSHHHTRKNISVAGRCVIEDVAEQTWTGKPVTPLIKACYRQEGKPAVELIFARDFFVTYKNNVKVGTATLIIHGKNGYRGQVKTTFSITGAK